MKEIIGLTGPTGAGKSSLTAVANEYGYTVIDCDKYARKAVEKGTNGLFALIKVFSSDILNEDETLNRAALAKKAFSSKENTELLNKTLLPYIAELVNKDIQNKQKILLDAPTLFESGMDRLCTKTVGVLAQKELRLKRIMERDGIDEQSATLRINAGKSDDFYKQNSDYIIVNNGDLSKVLNDFKNILE